MQIDITGQHIEITEALRTRVQEIFTRLQRHTDAQILHPHVVLHVDKNSHHCDVQVHIGQDVLVAKSEAADMYLAISQAAEKIERQMQTAKGRRKAQRNH